MERKRLWDKFTAYEREQIISHPAYARVYILYPVVIAIVPQDWLPSTLEQLPTGWKFQEERYLLLGRVVGKVDALLNVGLEALDSLAQELLLLLGDALQGVGGLLHTFGLREG